MYSTLARCRFYTCVLDALHECKLFTPMKKQNWLQSGMFGLKIFGYFSVHFPVFFSIIFNMDYRSLLQLRMQLVDADRGHMKQSESFPSIKLFADWAIWGNFISWLSNAPLWRDILNISFCTYRPLAVMALRFLMK